MRTRFFTFVLVGLLLETSLPCLTGGEIKLNQQKEAIVKSFLRQRNTLLFCNSNMYDLICDLIPLKYKIKLKNGEGRFNVEQDGEYEVWSRQDLRLKIKGQQLRDVEMRVGGEETSRNTGMKWIKLGSILLEKGKYEIQVKESRAYEVRSSSIDVIIALREEFKKQQVDIQEFINRPGVSLGYLFSKSSNNLINRYFYILQDSEYIIKAGLSPNFVRSRTSDSKNFRLGLQDELKKWFFKSSEATCNYFISESGILTLSLYLDGDSNEDEYIQMRREGIGVDLEKYPWLDLTYKVEDHKVQTIEIVLGIDFDGDGGVDEYVRGIYPKRAATKFNKFNYNALAKVKKHFPDEKHCDLVELELYPHKIWGVDTSLERRGKYKFYIKDLQFCNYTSEDFFEVADYALNSNWGEKKEFSKWKVISDLKDYSCRFQNDSLVVIARFGREVNENIILARSFKNLNLEQFPFIEFEYKVDGPLFQNLELILNLDFDKDGAVDKNIFFPLFLDTTFEKFRFDAFKLVEEAFPNKKEYHLLQIKLRLKERKENFLGFTQKREYAWYFKNIRICSTSFVSSVGFAFNKPIFEIDRKEYWFERKFKNKEETENLLFSEKVYLKKGEHFISNLLRERDNFKVEWIMVEPLISRCSAK